MFGFMICNKEGENYHSPQTFSSEQMEAMRKLIPDDAWGRVVVMWMMNHSQVDEEQLAHDIGQRGLQKYHELRETFRTPATEPDENARTPSVEA